MWGRVETTYSQCQNVTKHTVDTQLVSKSKITIISPLAQLRGCQKWLRNTDLNIQNSLHCIIHNNDVCYNIAEKEMS